MDIDESINSWTFEETIKTAESLMEVEKNMFKWDVIRHLRDFAENYREQLKEYQQLEEQGRLIKFPCKVGDTVYKIDPISNKVVQHKVIKFETDQVDFENYDYCFFHHFGKTVFLTESEAYEKLKEWNTRSIRQFALWREQL